MPMLPSHHGCRFTCRRPRPSPAPTHLEWAHTCIHGAPRWLGGGGGG
jgi:hypothetical protein